MKYLELDHPDIREIETWKNLFISRKLVGYTEGMISALEDVKGAEDPQVDMARRIGQGTSWGIHQQAHAQTLAVVRRAEVETVADIGCGDGLLVSALAKVRKRKGSYRGVQHVVGVDIDPSQIEMAHALTDARARDADIESASVDLLTTDVTNLEGSQAAALTSLDAVVSTEVIEHLPVDEYEEWASSLMELGAGMVVLTTPNKEYNALFSRDGLTDDGLRLPDHTFEFTVADFEGFAAETTLAHPDYTSAVLGVGTSRIGYGPPGLMAVFQQH